MSKRILAGIILLVAVAPQGVAATGFKAPDIAGRWTGRSYYTFTAGGTLTLDIVACGQSWCGIKVEADDKCAATVLKLDAATIADGDAHFTGTLTLEPGTEPYTVHATMFAPDAGAPLRMRLTGDTGGEYRAFRRTFPFESALARTGDAVCHAPATVSSLHRHN